MATSKKLSDMEYIATHMTKPVKTYQDRWCISFICADGYAYSVEEDGNRNKIKPHMVETLCKLVLRGKHPIQSK